MKTVLVAGMTPECGTTLVLKGLQTYWQRYYSAQTVDQMRLPTLTPQAMEDEMEPDLGHLWRSLCQRQHNADLLLIESAGSLASPITRDTTLATLAYEWRLPVIGVVDVKWEAIAPTVATLALVREAKATIAGLILNQHQPNPDIAPGAMADLLQSLTHSPILGTIPFIEDPTNGHALVNIASELMLDALVETLDTLKT